jgi:hypothetical protein
MRKLSPLGDMGFDMNKKLLSRSAAFLLLLALVLPFMAAGCMKSSGSGSFELPTRKLVESAEPQTFGNYTYLPYDDGTLMLTSYDGSESSIVIPRTIDGKNVVAIDTAMFAGNETLQSVEIGGNIEYIGDYAFFDCSALTDVKIGKNVWSIGTGAFDYTPWLDAISDDFVIVGDGVLIKYKGQDKYVKVPDSVKHLSSAFLQNFEVLYIELGDNVLTIGNCAFAGCEELRQVKIGKNVRMIGEAAFESCSALCSVSIPDKVERIGAYAFSYCYNLMTVCIGNSAREIGEYAFNMCVEMRSVVLPASLVSIDEYAFFNCISLVAVFYGGSEEQYAAINLPDSNYIIKDAFKIYGVSGGGHEE